MLESPLSKVVYVGNGVTTEFPFEFKVWGEEQILVALQDPYGVTRDAGAFSVSLTQTGGTVTYLHEGEPLPEGWKLAITRNMPFVQPVDLITGTRFDPAVIEERLDKDCAERQQLRETMGRAVLFPPTAQDDEVKTSEEFLAEMDDLKQQAQDAAGAAADAQAGAEQAKADAEALNAKTEQDTQAAIDTARQDFDGILEATTAQADRAAAQVGLASDQADRAKAEADRAQQIVDLGPATTTHLGVVQIGSGISVTTEGVISADIPDIDVATREKAGVVKPGDEMDIDATGTLDDKRDVLYMAEKPTEAPTNLKNGGLVFYGDDGFGGGGSGGGGGATQELTEEHVVGKLNGKPVYEKTFSFTSPSKVNTIESVYAYGGNDIDVIISIDGTVQATASYTPLNFYYSTTNFVCTWASYGLKEVKMFVASQANVSSPCLATIRYTKNTD